MNKKDFENFMQREGKDLKLNNYYEQLGNDSNKKYKGQWTSDRSHAHGLGVLISKGENDFTYHGQFKNSVFDGPGRLVKNQDIF